MLKEACLHRKVNRGCTRPSRNIYNSSTLYCFPRTLLHSWSWLERYSVFSEIVITESTKHWENIPKWINNFFFLSTDVQLDKTSARTQSEPLTLPTGNQPCSNLLSYLLLALKTSSFPSLQSKLSRQDAPQAMIYMPAIWEGAHTCRCSSLSF